MRNTCLLKLWVPGETSQNGATGEIHNLYTFRR